MKKVNIGIIVLLIITISVVFIPNIYADDVTIVEPGNNTLSEAVKSAKEGDTLKLKVGDYKGNEDIVIDKNITIEGERPYGSGNSDATRVYPQIIIKKTDKDISKVKLAKFASSLSTPGKNHVYIDVQTPVTLDLEDIFIWYIYRAPDTPEAEEGANKDAIALKLSKDDDSSIDSSGSTVNITNSRLVAFFDGIDVASSNNEINLITEPNRNDTSSKFTEIAGKLAIKLDNGTGNKINANEGSKIDGRSAFLSSEEAIAVYNQENLTIDLDGVTIQGNEPHENIPTHLFSLDSPSGTNKNCTLKLRGNTKIIDDNDKEAGSCVFNFGDDVNTEQDYNNKIIIEKTVTFDPKTIKRKYNISEDYAVVGIYDIKGTCTVNAYKKNTTISEDKLPKKDIPNYKLKDMYYLSGDDEGDKTEGKSYTQETTISENMDIHPNYVALIKVKIQGDGDKTYTLEEGQKLSDLETQSDAKTALDKLRNEKNKSFVEFVDDNGEKIDENYTFEKGENFTDEEGVTYTITPKYNVTLSIDGIEEGSKTVPEGTKYADIKDDLIQKANKENKQFEKFVSGGTDVNDDTTFTENTTLTPKYTVKITIDGIAGDDNYIEVAEGTKYADVKEQLIQKAQKDITTKKFDHFEEITSDQESSHTFNENTTLKPKYKVTITINGLEADNTIDVDENTPYSEVKENLEQKVKKDKKTFVGFEEIENAESYTFKENITLTPKYTVRITFIGIDTDNTLDVADGTKYNDIKTELEEKVKKDKKTFKKFNEIESEESYVFSEDISLTPTYTVRITIKGIDNAYLDVDENAKYEATVESQLKEKANKDNKQFKKFVKDDDSDINNETTFTEDTTITPKYTVDVSINGIENSKISVDEGATYESIADQLTEKLTTQENFKGFINQKDKSSITNETQFNENTVLIAKYTITITIKYGEDQEETFELETGNTLSNLNEEDAAKLEAIKNNTANWHEVWKRLVGFKNTKDQQLINEAETVFTEDTTLEAVIENIKGDVDQNGEINIFDVHRALEGLVKKDLTQTQLELANVISDNDFNIFDVHKLLEFVVKKITTLD